MMNWLDIYRQKLRERIDVNDTCETSSEYREAVKEICKRDKLFFINNFCWTYDPRPDRKPNHLPFITYEIQDEYIKWLDERFEFQEDGLTEKSRDMGATWTFLAWVLHKWLFSDTFTGLLGSRVEDLVDKTDSPDSLFWKLDYMLEKLPKFLKPKGYKKSDHRKNMLIKNPVNGNVIKGESSNSAFGRQGRYTIIGMDEFAFWENGYSAWTSAGEATRCRFPLSTPNGKNNKFSDLRFNSTIKRFAMKWNRHPLKSDEWYAKTKLRLTEREFAQEIDIDYEASGGDIWLPAYVTNKAEIELTEPIVPDSEWYIYGSIDYHSKNPASCHIYAIDFDNCLYVIDERYKGESTSDEVADWFTSHSLFSRLKYITADPQIWTPDQQVRQGLKSVMTSHAQLMIDRGLKGLLIPGIKGQDLLGRTLINKRIEDGRFKVSPLCPYMRWELGEALHWASMSETLSATKNINEALADKNNHAWDDLKYLLTKNPEKPKVYVPEEKVKYKSLEWFEVMEKLQSRNTEGAFI